MTTVQNMEVQFTIQNHVATIIIDRPDDGNRLSPDTL